MKKVSKKALNTAFWRWWYGNLTCFTHEHMQTFGYMWAMMSVIEDLYADEAEQKEKLKTYYPFFNTEPQIGCIVVGVTCGMEEARANGNETVDDEMINGIRAGLMGPLAGIGDSLIVGTYIPILLGIAVGLAEGGSVLGPIFYIVAWNATSIWFQKFIFDKGYEMGGSAVELIVGDVATAFRESCVTLGQVVVGAMCGSWLSVTTPLVVATNSEGNPVLLQNNLDGAFPGILSMLAVLFCWFMMAKKNVSPIKMMVIMVVVGVVGSVCGILG
jgi:mannose/fructose/N-acetylgalactosamine-specific phosphotransferase system component IID